MTFAAGSPERPGGTAPHVLVADVDRPVLGAGDRHHLSRVRRLRDGDPVTVTDGAGRWRWCEFGDELRPTCEVVHDEAPAPLLTIGFALVKGQRPELVVQKLTELGIDVIIPFVAARSVTRWDDSKSDRNHERLVTIAREAAQQSRRTWFPVVERVTTFEAVSSLDGAAMAERDGAPVDEAAHTVLIGPEGGWDPVELRLPRVGLGPTVLRAETAAIAAGVLLVSRRSESVR